MLNKADIETLFARFQANNPDPKTELNYTNDFTLLIAVLLSAQATDVGVNKATKALFERVKGPEDILDLGHDALLQYVRTIGLYKTKAANIMKLCQILVDHYKGEVPRSREALESLPGVGRKTANVVLHVAFGEDTIAVDTHIFRVSNRLGLSNGKTPLKVEEDLIKKVPQKYKYGAHHWLILHGRYVCKARAPQCQKCSVVDICQFKDKLLNHNS